MKHIFYTGLLIICTSLGGCNQKNLVQQKDLAKKAEIEAKKSAMVAHKRAKEAQKAAMISQQVAIKAKKAAMASKMAEQKALLQQRSCEQNNRILRDKLKELQKKK